MAYTFGSAGRLKLLTIYTSKEIAQSYSNKDIVPDTEVRFALRLTEANKDSLFNDAVSSEILQKIEGMTERKGNGYITAKFGDVQLRDISTGGKALLLATKFKDEFIITIDELGYNCIYLLFEICKKMDIEVISTRILYHMKDDFVAVVNGKRLCGDGITGEMEKLL